MNNSTTTFKQRYAGKSTLVIAILIAHIVAFHTQPACGEGAGEGITQRYRKALEMNPDDTDARYLLGLSLVRERAYEEALTHLLKVYPSKSGKTDMNYNIGLAYTGAGNLQKAFQHFIKVDEINPVEARDRFHLDLALYNLGLSFQKEGKLEEALKAYQEAIRINPDQANAYCQKGQVLLQKKDYDNALNSLLTCKNKSPDRKETNQYIASIYLARGIEELNKKNNIEARVNLGKVIELNPDNENAYYYLGYLDYLEEDYKKALSSFEKVKVTNREDMKKALSSILHNVGIAMQRNEDWEGAISAFSIAASFNKGNPDSHFFLGYSYMKATQVDPAIASFKETLRLDPKHQRAAVNLAIVSEIALKNHLEAGAEFLRKGSYKDAHREFSLALDIDPNNARGKEGKDAAESELKKIERAELDKKEKEISSRLLEGGRYIKEGKFLDAVKAFEAVLAIDQTNQKARDEIGRCRSVLKEEVRNRLSSAQKAFSEGRYYDASVEYKTVLAIEPGEKAASLALSESLNRLSAQVSPLLGRAREHETAGRFPEAVAAYAAILGIQPDNKEAMEGRTKNSDRLEKAFNDALSKGREFVKTGELIKAVERLKAALDLKPDNEVVLKEFKAVAERLKKVVDSKFADADRAFKAGRYSEAASSYKTVLIIEPENKAAAAGLQNATRTRDEAIEKKMTSGLKSYKEGELHQALLLFGEVLQIDSGNAEALRMQKEARSRIDETTAPWMKAGIDAFKKGDADTSIVSFKKVLNVDPGNREAKEYLGKVDVQKARVSVGKEVEKYYLKGIELYTDGKYREAIDSWKKVLELDPKHEKSLLNIEKAKRKMEGVMDTK